MRIISGQFKGRKLTSFSAQHLRPTTDRVKESIFNKLSYLVSGARVLDLFAGTGSLSLEAYSRGAQELFLIEKNKKSVIIIKKNLQLLGLEKNKNIHLLQQDVFSFLNSPQLIMNAKFDLILIDPPFTEKIAHQVMESVGRSQLLDQGGVLVIESSAHEHIADQYSSYILLDRRDFGDKKVSYFIRE